MSKHTPGPWRAEVNAMGDKLCIWSGAYPVAIVRDAHEQSANARLIAAAPELLEVLKMAQRELHTTKSMLRAAKVPGTATTQMVIEQCDAAIAKAEGK